jgi:hypothetical protein
MRSFFAADDALPRADPALTGQVGKASVEARFEVDTRRLVTEGVVHFDHLRRRGISIRFDLARRHE